MTKPSPIDMSAIEISSAQSNAFDLFHHLMQDPNLSNSQKHKPIAIAIQTLLNDARSNMMTRTHDANWTPHRIYCKYSIFEHTHVTNGLVMANLSTDREILDACYLFLRMYYNLESNAHIEVEKLTRHIDHTDGKDDIEIDVKKLTMVTVQLSDHALVTKNISEDTPPM